MVSPINIVIADDHPIFRKGSVNLIAEDAIGHRERILPCALRAVGVSQRSRRTCPRSLKWAGSSTEITTSPCRPFLTFLPPIPRELRAPNRGYEFSGLGEKSPPLGDKAHPNHQDAVAKLGRGNADSGAPAQIPTEQAKTQSGQGPGGRLRNRSHLQVSKGSLCRGPGGKGLGGDAKAHLTAGKHGVGA